MQYNDVYILDINEARSSLISKVVFDFERKLLSVYLRFKTHPLTYDNVPLKEFENLCSSESIGKYYLHYIKPNFSLTKLRNMAQRPKGINIAKDEVRWIDISIDVQKIIKDWLIAGEKGTYLNVKLRMLPDGQVDQYECLGFVTQTVPKEVYNAAEAEKKGSGRDIKAPILGNAKELQWGDRNEETIPGGLQGSPYKEGEGGDNLPF